MGASGSKHMFILLGGKCQVRKSEFYVKGNTKERTIDMLMSLRIPK